MFDNAICKLKGTAVRFVRDESGVISVDYIAFAAALFGLGLYAATEIRTGTGGAASQMENAFAGESITLAQATVDDDTDSGTEDDGYSDGGSEDGGDTGGEEPGDPFLDPEPEPTPEPEPEVEPEPEPEGPPPGCWYNGAGRLKCN